jgi:hypothetical protein
MWAHRNDYLEGADVEQWQQFLRGKDLYLAVVNGKFDQATFDATCAFQKGESLKEDGVVGNQTLGLALRLGVGVLEDDASVPDGAAWPSPPAFAALGPQGRTQVFGAYKFSPAPTAGNPEGISIDAGWVKENLVVVGIPQLAHIKGAPGSGNIQVHRLAAKPLQQLFARWETAGLLDRVRSYGGAFNPRFIRGSNTTLSAHAWGTAFDINVPWNGLGVMPALKGKEGCVRDLVPIANELGFYWGGHFQKRPDGMHFELSRV